MNRLLPLLAVPVLVLGLGACTDMDALDRGATDPTPRSLGEPVAAEHGAPSWEFVVRAGGARVEAFPTGIVAPEELRGDQVLRLSAVDPAVTVFADRPQRLAGQLRPDELLALWHGGTFGQDPPNAAVVLGDAVVSVELRGAVYDPASSTVVFVVGRLDQVGGAPGPLLPEGDLGPVTVFVDGSGALDTPVTDTVTTPDVAVLGEAPAEPMGALYQTIASSTGPAFQNATAPTDDVAPDQATTDQQVSTLYSVDTVAGPDTDLPAPGSSTPTPGLPAILAVLSALGGSG